MERAHRFLIHFTRTVTVSRRHSSRTTDPPSEAQGTLQVFARGGDRDMGAMPQYLNGRRGRVWSAEKVAQRLPSFFTEKNFTRSCEMQRTPLQPERWSRILQGTLEQILLRHRHRLSYQQVRLLLRRRHHLR